MPTPLQINNKISISSIIPILLTKNNTVTDTDKKISINNKITIKIIIKITISIKKKNKPKINEVKIFYLILVKLKY